VPGQKALANILKTLSL